MNPPKTPIWPPKTTPDYLLCMWRDIYNHCNREGRTTKLFCAEQDSCHLSQQPFCPFCAFRRLTPWYLCDTEHSIVVCKDLQPKGYSYRILVAGFGKDWHVPYSRLSLPKQHLLLVLLKAIAHNHIIANQARDLVKIDFDHSFPDHAHLQACMQARELSQ